MPIPRIIPSHRQPSSRYRGWQLRNVRHAFTLTELVVAIVVISILAGMTMVGINSTQQTARLAQTEGLVSRINEVIMNHWDDYHFRMLPVQFDFPDNSEANANTTPLQLIPQEAGRVRLMMLRDLMRMELPDRRSDLFDFSTNPPTPTGSSGPIQAVGVRYAKSSNPNEPIYEASREVRNIFWDKAASLQGYQSRIISSFGALANVSNWTEENEGSECLYLILSTLTMNGLPALEMIAPFQIADVDEDSIPEIVDAWGNPITFIRWPAGSEHPTIRPEYADEFDILSSDWGALRQNVEVPYSIRPLIVSAGSDEQLGLVTSLNPNWLPYHRMTWPGSATDGEIGDHVFIDPFLRVYTGGIGASNATPSPNRYLRPGAFLSSGRPLAADNISNFDL